MAPIVHITVAVWGCIPSAIMYAVQISTVCDVGDFYGFFTWCNITVGHMCIQEDGVDMHYHDLVVVP